MNFRDQGIVLSKIALKEKNSIVTVFTENNGIYSGVLRQYSKKNGDNLLEGNLVDFFWTSRLHEHIGTARAELVKSYNNYIMFDKVKLYAFSSIVAILKIAFCEREPHNNLFPKLIEFIDSLKTDFSLINYIKFELEILKEAGYQIQLKSCVATGSVNNLIYVSPKSGQAVCKEAGDPYKDKMLRLPQFLINHEEKAFKSDIIDSFRLTSYFFERYIFANRPDLPARDSFINIIQNMFIL